MSKAGQIEHCVQNGIPLDHIPVIDFHTHVAGSSEFYYIPKSKPQQIMEKMDLPTFHDTMSELWGVKKIKDEEDVNDPCLSDFCHNGIRTVGSGERSKSN